MNEEEEEEENKRIKGYGHGWDGMEK